MLKICFKNKQKTSPPRHITLKLTKTKGKDKILKVAGEKIKQEQNTVDFLIETLEARSWGFILGEERKNSNNNEKQMPD